MGSKFSFDPKEGMRFIFIFITCMISRRRRGGPAGGGTAGGPMVQVEQTPDRCSLQYGRSHLPHRVTT